ncbi:MAG: UDP-N-acetylenolpyruvoylglucosamine reductase [Syntrophus sp. SKADARSKE-3]|nr:UDP-N-acetylenolpyruvoylglucosamine reductase [Syntrophus sp. SKADARSKE-3]
MNDEIRQEIGRLISGNIEVDEPMGNHASMGVGGPADVVAYPGTPEEMGNLLAFLSENRIPFFPVGNWTNLIVRDGGYRGVVVSLKKLRMVCLEGNHSEEDDREGFRYVRAQSGAGLSDLLALSIEAGLTGLEFSAGIPGSVGGAVKMNAGAYGQEMKDVIATVSLIETNGRLRIYNRDELVFHYRCLDIPVGSVIVEATFRLQVGSRETVREKVLDILAKRKGKHPLAYRNAGSIFKNPKGQPAGRIIEEAGLKGLQVGGAMVSEMHGNFIVNLGTALAKDVTTLIAMIQETVQARKGILLDPEVVIVGDDA